jgi:hypothetical protein
MNGFWLCLGAFILVGVVSSRCKQNCYLGSNLYSAPLVSKHCCDYKARNKCNTFIMVNEHEFICRQCQIGFRVVGGKCVKIQGRGIDSKNNCINPDMDSVEFDSCSVCRINGKNINIPVMNNNTKKFDCLPLELTSPSRPLLENCHASAVYQGIVLCHECKRGYYYHGVQGKCIKQDKLMNGCLVSFVEGKCDICRPSLQYDIRNYTCVSKRLNINYKQYKIEMENKKKFINEQVGASDNEFLHPFMEQLNRMDQMSHMGKDNSDFPTNPSSRTSNIRITSNNIQLSTDSKVHSMVGVSPGRNEEPSLEIIQQPFPSSLIRKEL